MAVVTDTATTLRCDHGGTILTRSSAKLTISTAPVLLFPDLPGFTWNPGCTAPNPGPCASTAAVVSGAAARLTSNGVPVLLSTLVAISNTLSPITAEPAPNHGTLTAV